MLFSKQQKIDQKTHCWGKKCGELSRTGWSAGSNLGSSQRVGGGGCAQLCPMCPALPCFSSSSVRSWHIRLAPIVTHGDQAVSWQKLNNACHTKLERWLSWVTEPKKDSFFFKLEKLEGRSRKPPPLCLWRGPMQLKPRERWDRSTWLQISMLLLCNYKRCIEIFTHMNSQMELRPLERLHRGTRKFWEYLVLYSLLSRLHLFP